MQPLKIFVGYDTREDIAFQVCKQSILDTASVPVEIIPLNQRVLRKEKLYKRPVDPLASTEFTFTRFLVPHLTEYNGWALFIDCDFVALTDIKELFDQADDQYAVMCAHHDYTPKEGIKMDGQKQTVYPRKNWSSCVLFNCSHVANAKLNLGLINNPDTTGAYLHRFSWLYDTQIGEISHEWNWLVGWYKEPKDGKPKMLHYTEGGPWFEQYQDCEYANEYYKVERKYQQQLIDDYKDTVTYPTQLTLSDSKKKLVDDLLKTLVDPTGQFYNVKADNVIREIDDMVRNKKKSGYKVVAIHPGDSFDLDKKHLSYDRLLEAFCSGTHGRLGDFDQELDTSIPLVIRGLGGNSQRAINHCWDTGRDFYAIDTGYFGNERSKAKIWHRITKNNLQQLEIIDRPTDRLRRHAWKYRKFKPGSKILICPPSDKVMKIFGQPVAEEWTKNVLAELKKYTDRPIEIRMKPIRSERISTDTIEDALSDDVHCLITYNSIAAVEALVNGKPAITLGPNAASSLAGNDLSQVEKLPVHDKDTMTAFMAHLSYCQFTHQEMLDGTAWRMINGDN
jgi:lipopolysaccharide biosynthesis glycosyltransferase